MSQPGNPHGRTSLTLGQHRWQRIRRKGKPNRASFAPWTTLALRYLMLCDSVTNGFLIWGTTMPSDAACQAASGFLLASGALLASLTSFGIAWRAQAVGRGVVQSAQALRWMQALIGSLVVREWTKEDGCSV